MVVREKRMVVINDLLLIDDAAEVSTRVSHGGGCLERRLRFTLQSGDRSVVDRLNSYWFDALYTVELTTLRRGLSVLSADLTFADSISHRAGRPAREESAGPVQAIRQDAHSIRTRRKARSPG